MKIGDIYIEKQRNPFSENKKTVVDIKHGWVKYVIHKNRIGFWIQLITGITCECPIATFERRHIKKD